MRLTGGDGTTGHRCDCLHEACTEFGNVIIIGDDDS